METCVELPICCIYTHPEFIRIPWIGLHASGADEMEVQYSPV